MRLLTEAARPSSALMARWLPALLGCLALLLALAPAVQAAPRIGVAASAGRTFAAAARSVDAGGSLTVTGLRLEGQAADATLELQRLEAWDPAAKIVVHSGSVATITEGPPDTRYFQGSLAGAPGSTALLSVDAAGGVSGMQAQQAGQAQQDGAASRKLLQTSVRVALLALETDGELYKRFGGTTAIKNYVGQLVAYANTIFVKEIGVELRITWLGLYNNPTTDPWPTLSPVPGAQPPLNLDSDQGLEFLKAYWNNPANKRTSVKRTLVHMLSGQNTTGGVAFRAQLCDNFELGGTAYKQYVSDYGFTGALTSQDQLDWSGNPNEYPTQPVWDATGFIHEMGHQFGSMHTHDYCKVTPSDPTTIDDCAPSANGCAQTQIGVLPTCTGTPGYAGGAGTIMSYCDAVRNRYQDVAMTFGLNHPCGRRPGRVVTVMKAHVQDRATKYPACLPLRDSLPSPPPAPVRGPNGQWATPIVVPDALPFNSSVFSTFWATGAPEYKCDDYAAWNSVYVFRWYAARAYDNAQVTVSSCGRLQNTGVPILSIRSAATSNNAGPYGCVAKSAYSCPKFNDDAFTATFKAAADTFYYLVVAPNGQPAPKLSVSVKAVMGNPRGSWTNAIAVPIDPYASSTKTAWTSGEYKSFLPAGVPASVCNDGSSGRPFIAHKWFSGTALKNGTAWRAASKLTLSSCYATGTNAVALSVRSSKNTANPAAGPFTCTTRMASGCGTGKVGFKLDVKVTTNTTYWFVVTPVNSTKLPASFRLTTALTW
ncbi:Reprolysin (M12B) family zinc metalloprotease [Chlorella sorokiniana]|uniref:Reprolysin (M12B) family zinc metalloprotease n=1 Tax=Chlorella sorokiniana TaxID=3076 RepID=A0A2P6U3V7_CHLSO|nr:Reprolysin (M12B) family zinc metalloprotease [Chlorella sorokiniana]|eukprot:PRW61007.1 Reprolysin (M12B) family zinc metalloprotease [Chlorella sorokiniana]